MEFCTILLLLPLNLSSQHTQPRQFVSNLLPQIIQKLAQTPRTVQILWQVNTAGAADPAPAFWRSTKYP